MTCQLVGLLDDPPVGGIGGGSASWWDWWRTCQLMGEQPGGVGGTTGEQSP